MSNIEKPTVKNQHGKRKDNFNGTLGKSDRVEIAAVSDKRKIIKKKGVYFILFQPVIKIR
jgi:hypothetical protein